MITTEHVQGWDEFVTCVNDLRDGSVDRWIFRGQANSGWTLKTSLDLAVDRFPSHLADRQSAERFLLREFRRHFHRYSPHLPHEDDTLEWLSLLQHHGAPTRLLDWTFSEYVALYFAVQSAPVTSEEQASKCAVWAVNQTKCWEMLKEHLRRDKRRKIDVNDKDRNVTNWILTKFAKPMVCALNPFLLNTRLTIQQGTFLIPTDLTRSFQANFDESIGRKPWWRKIEIECTEGFLITALTNLHRMNVTEVNLFPGIDGLARSLRNVLPLRHLHPQR